MCPTSPFCPYAAIPRTEGSQRSVKRAHSSAHAGVPACTGPEGKGLAKGGGARAHTSEHAGVPACAGVAGLTWSAFPLMGGGGAARRIAFGGTVFFILVAISSIAGTTVVAM